MKQLHKEYGHPFVLEPTKLIRLIDTIHNRLDSHAHTTKQDHFEVFLSQNRREELTSVDAVLELENSRKQKIQRLLITSNAGTEGALRAEHEVQVDFGAIKTSRDANNKNIKVIAVSVRSTDSGWASGTLSDVEEQVERTWQRYTPSILGIITILVCVLVLLISQFVSFNEVNLSSHLWLRGVDLDRVERILKENRTITDAEAREISTMQYRNILEDSRPRQSTAKGQKRPFLVIVVPVLIVIVCGFALLITCYPSTVFLWGDEMERHSHMLQRRKVLWGIIIAVTITGVASKLFSRVLDSWLSQ